MEGWQVRPRKRCCTRVTMDERIERFRACISRPGEDVPEFTARFVTLWMTVSGIGGIIEVEATARYIIGLPQAWRPWAARVADIFSERSPPTFAEKVYFSRFFTYVLRTWADRRCVAPQLPIVEEDMDMFRVPFTSVLPEERTIEMDRSAPPAPKPPLITIASHDDEAGPSGTQLEPIAEEDPEEDPDEEPMEVTDGSTTLHFRRDFDAEGRPGHWYIPSSP
ncbi:hypothetical protein C2S52_009186 [Perilla frutescens var. hirtella]|nr:hypothetical protein C2S52_009186 [Perilla frutescens var. hirtella]